MERDTRTKHEGAPNSSVFFFLVHMPTSDSDPIQMPVVVMFNILIGDVMDGAPVLRFLFPAATREESLVYWLLPAEAPSIPETERRHQQMSCDPPPPHTLCTEIEFCDQRA
jgi:hypothetical protein